MARKLREGGRNRRLPRPLRRCRSEPGIAGACKERRDATHLPPSQRGSQPQQKAIASSPHTPNMNIQGRMEQSLETGPGDPWAGGVSAFGNCIFSLCGWVALQSWAYHPVGTPQCGRTGTWHAGPHSTCRRAGAWGCRSVGRRTARRRRRSGSRGPKGSTGPSRHPPPAARGHKKLLEPSPSSSTPSCSLPGRAKVWSHVKITSQYLPVSPARALIQQRTYFT